MVAVEFGFLSYLVWGGGGDELVKAELLYCTVLYIYCTKLFLEKDVIVPR